MATPAQAERKLPPAKPTAAFQKATSIGRDVQTPKIKRQLAMRHLGPSR